MIDDNAFSIEFNSMICLREKIISELSDQFQGKKVIHLDVPIHLNIGDMLIDWGTCVLFSEMSVDLIDRVGVIDQERFFKYKDKVQADTVLVLHGGGNFGDLYPHHQLLRLKILQCFPDNPIILLPQSVHYQNESLIKKDMVFFAKHSNVVVYVRDTYSFELLRSYLSEDQLKILPDMAHMLIEKWSWQSQLPKEKLVFRRLDIESTGTPVGDTFDWRDLVGSYERRRFRRLKKLMKAQGFLSFNLRAHVFWLPFRKYMLQLAVDKYKDYGVIDTDRLHGVILSQLMGKKCIARDNSYGKIARYIDTWF